MADDPIPNGWTAEEWAEWHGVVCPPIEGREIEGVSCCFRYDEITGPIPVTHVGTWPKRSRAVSVAAWTVAAMVVIVAGLAVAVLVLFLVAVVQALLDLIVH